VSAATFDEDRARRIRAIRKIVDIEGTSAEAVFGMIVDTGFRIYFERRRRALDVRGARKAPSGLRLAVNQPI
jgi:hypothetical protein